LEFEILLDTIKQAREAAGLSQRHVASKMCLEVTTIGRIERGTRSLDVIEFVELARAIGVDPLELLGRFLIAEASAKVSRRSEASNNF